MPNNIIEIKMGRLSGNGHYKAELSGIVMDVSPGPDYGV
jgi:hypothetical protein